MNAIKWSMTHYTLHDLEKITGILAPTIRIWERRYNIIKPKRTDTNRRWYDDDDLRRLINISILYQSGIKISKIAKYSQSDLEDKVEFLKSDTNLSDTIIKSLIAAMVSYNESVANEIFLRSVRKIGFEETFSNVVFPFFIRVGILWHTGSVNPGAEHFISNFFRGKLIAEIDSLPVATNPKRKRAIIFLPENEMHEIGLLFFTYLIRKTGHETLYLGQATPFFALTEASEKWHPDILITAVLSELSVYEPEDYFNTLSKTFKSQKILVSGSLAEKPFIEKYKNVYPIRSASDLRAHF